MRRQLICIAGYLNALDNSDEDAYQHITVFKELGQCVTSLKLNKTLLTNIEH